MNIKEINVKERIVNNRILIGNPVSIIDYPILYKKYSINNNKKLYFYASSEEGNEDVIFKNNEANNELKYKYFGRIDHISDFVLQLLSNKQILITDKVFEKKTYEGDYGRSISETHRGIFLKHGYIIDLINEKGFDFLEENKDLIIENFVYNSNIISNKFCVVHLKKNTYFKLISIGGTEHLIYFKKDDWNILDD